MLQLEDTSSLDQDGKRIRQAAAWAVALEALFFISLGLGHLPFLRNPFNSADYVEAQIIQLPPNAHLTGVEAVKDEVGRVVGLRGRDRDIPGPWSAPEN